MKLHNRQLLAADNSRTTKHKRHLRQRHSAISLDDQNYTKRQKITVSEETETLTRVQGPGPSRNERNTTSSNRFALVHSSRKRWDSRKRRDSSARDGQRQWTYSSRDCSQFKGAFLFSI